jgi:hypothetical protein
MKKIVLVFIIALVFISCKKANAVPVGNNFYFQNPQPINDSELNSIPNKFQGIYRNSDSTFLKITKNAIFEQSSFKIRLHKNQLDSLKQEFTIENGKYITKDKKEVYNSKSVGDSIELSSKNTDTIFIFSNSQKAKRINGCLVLNQKDSIFWTLRLISLNKNKLIIKHLYSNDDLNKMDSLTKVHSKSIDSTSFVISPSRREFSDFFELKNFGFDQEYIKISK